MNGIGIAHKDIKIYIDIDIEYTCTSTCTCTSTSTSTCTYTCTWTWILSQSRIINLCRGSDRWIEPYTSYWQFQRTMRFAVIEPSDRYQFKRPIKRSSSTKFGQIEWIIIIIIIIIIIMIIIIIRFDSIRFDSMRLKCD
jgi:hypothetical protein